MTFLQSTIDMTFKWYDKKLLKLARMCKSCQKLDISRASDYKDHLITALTPKLMRRKWNKLYCWINIQQFKRPQTFVCMCNRSDCIYSELTSMICCRMLSTSLVSILMPARSSWGRRAVRSITTFFRMSSRVSCADLIRHRCLNEANSQFKV